MIILGEKGMVKGITHGTVKELFGFGDVGFGVGDHGMGACNWSRRLGRKGRT